MNWALGLFISVVVGGFSAKLFTYISRRSYNYVNPIKRPFKASVIGLLEGVFFSTVIAFEISGAAISMFAWITLKMAVGWNDEITNKDFEGNPDKTAIKFTALAGSLINLYFAILGGLVIRGELLSGEVLKLENILSGVY